MTKKNKSTCILDDTTYEAAILLIQILQKKKVISLQQEAMAVQYLLKKIA